MAKIITLLVLCLAISSCNDDRRFDSKRDNLKFVYNPWTTVDFNGKAITVELGDLHYRDTLLLSVEDENKIRRSFAENEIGKMKGEFHYVNDMLKCRLRTSKAAAGLLVDLHVGLSDQEI